MTMNNLRRYVRLVAFLLAALFCGLSALILPAGAAPDTVYLGDRQDLFLGRDSLDGLGMNTAHSGEPIKIGKTTFDKGVGFHCQPDRDAYVEFDISGLGLAYFAASVGVLSEASYFLEWGNISFHVYGDGELLASSPTRNWGEEPYFLSCSVEGVKTLRLVQKNEGSHSCDAGVWGDARLTAEKPADPREGETMPDTFDPNKTTKPQPAELTAGEYAYLSDLYWLGSNTYPGNAVGRDCNTANEIIFSTNGSFFAKGVGMHAVSSGYEAYIDVNLEGLGYKTFAAYVGVCETLTAHDISMASVKFAVIGDGKVLAESGVMTFGQPMERLDCRIEGVKTLRLAVAGAPGISGAWGTFGGAAVSRADAIADALLFSDLTFEEIVTTAPETVPVTEPVTEPATDPLEETTAVGAETTSDAPPAVTEPATATGCTAGLSAAAPVLAGMAAAITLAKRKEE